jgi:hypothetical protein
MTTDDSDAAIKRLIELQTDETSVLLRQRWIAPSAVISPTA